MKNKFFVLVKNNWRLVLASVSILILTMTIRLSTLNQMGQTWDESEYVTQGYKMDGLLLKGDFSNSYFYTTYDHPPFVKYIYGITAHLDQKGIDKQGNTIFNYDYTYSRVLSAFLGSLSAVIILIIAWEYISPFVAVTASIIFSTLPFFVGLSQLVTTESFLMFFFTASVYSFLRLLKKYSLIKLILTGFLTGLALQTKQSNVLLFPLFGLFYLMWYWKVGQKSSETFWNRRLFAVFWILVISLVIFILIWPMPYFHLDVISQINQKIWLVKTSPPIIYWGELMFSPIVYFLTMFFITTPFLILIFSLFGLQQIDKYKNWVLYGLIIWFMLPFLQSFYPWRQNGVRYIIEIYAPLSIIAALGVDYIIKRLGLGNKGKLFFILLISMYMFLILNQMKPYYLDYFNELVGGPKNVYDKKYFELGWWGQGLREAGYYLKYNAKPNAKVGLYISPQHSFPPVKDLTLFRIDPEESYNPKVKYDYIVVNYYHVLREGFDDSQIKTDYKLIYQVKAGGAPIVDIYSRK